MIRLKLILISSFVLVIFFLVTVFSFFFQEYFSENYKNIRYPTDFSESVAMVPPIGWNGWNRFRCSPELNEKTIKEMVDAIISKGMKNVGYQYVVLDDCWQIARNADGEIIADQQRFPSGIKNIADYVHERGLKFGIYTSGGRITCEKRPGSYGYEKKDVETYASWGVDYIKVDWCGIEYLDTRVQYTKWRQAIDEVDRPMVLSIAIAAIDRIDNNQVWVWGDKIGDMWRTAIDINDYWPDMLRVLDKNSLYAEYNKPGSWNDADMLQVGNGGMTEDEYKVHFSMWAMMASPLMAGNDIRNMSPEITKILTNKEIIKINQDPLGFQAQSIKNEEGKQVWVKILSQKGSRAVALLNRSDEKAVIGFQLSDLYLQRVGYFRDLWNPLHKGLLVDSYYRVVAPHSIVVITVQGIDLPVNLAKYPPQAKTVKSGLIGFADASNVVNAVEDENQRILLRGYANSTVSFNLGGSCSNFEGKITSIDKGVSDESQLQVYLDGNLVFESPKLTGNFPEQAISINTVNARKLDLYFSPVDNTHQNFDNVILKDLKISCE